MKKVNLFLVGLVTMVTLSIGFLSCGGGNRNSNSNNSNSSDNPFVGTWVPKDDNNKFEIKQIKIGNFGVTGGKYAIIYKDGKIERGDWEITVENTDWSKCVICLDYPMEFDDTSCQNATYGGDYLNLKLKKIN